MTRAIAAAVLMLVAVSSAWAQLTYPPLICKESGAVESDVTTALDFDGGDFNVTCTSGACAIAAGPNLVINGGADVGEADDFAATVDLVGKDLRLPSAANATIDTAGAVTVDSTRNQLVYYGTAQVVLDPVRSFCVTIERIAAADDDYLIWLAPQDVTLTSVGCYCRGTCTTKALFTLEDNSANAMTITGSNPTCAVTTGTATFAAVTAANTLTAGEGLRFDVSNAVSPETDIYTLCVTYTLVRG